MPRMSGCHPLDASEMWCSIWYESYNHWEALYVKHRVPDGSPLDVDLRLPVGAGEGPRDGEALAAEDLPGPRRPGDGRDRADGGKGQEEQEQGRRAPQEQLTVAESSSLRDESERLRAEVLRLQAQVDELEGLVSRIAAQCGEVLKAGE